MFPCKICKKLLSRKHDLKRHIKSVHTKQKFPCNLCFSVFNWKKNLNRHIKINHGELGPHPFPCLQCDHKTTDKSNLNKHIKNKHGKAEYKCDICNKTFNRKDNMMKHKKTHEKTKQDTHEQYEEGENPNKNHATGKPAQNNQEEIFQCRRKYNISRHMKVHENKSERKEQKILDDIIFEMQEYNRKIELGRKIKEIMDKNPQFNQNGLSKDNKEALEIFKHEEEFMANTKNKQGENNFYYYMPNSP